MFLPKIAYIHYDILCDSHYIMVEGTIYNKTTSNIKTKVEYSKIIIDLQKELAYFPEDSHFEKIKKYECLYPKRDSTSKVYFAGKQTSNYITLKKYLPHCVTPFPFTNNTKYKVWGMNTDAMGFILIYYKKIFQHLDYSEIFQKFNPEKTIKILDFLR